MTMSETVPQPPIPPPLAPALLLIKSNDLLTPSRNFAAVGITHDDEDEALNALNIFVQKTITKVKPVPQKGPNCGIAALSMVSQLTPSQPTIEYIWNQAKEKGFTNNGEMFSAHNMKLLAESVLSPWCSVEMRTNGLKINQDDIIGRLNSGDLMLIPYDADKNHSPCCLRGHKAHWALVCGALCSQDGTWHVAARHGKTSHLAIWPFHDLALSNDNLAEFDPSREADGLTYVLPPGGLKEGLASKFILLRLK